MGVQIIKGKIIIINKAIIYKNFFLKAKGLMFSKKLKNDSAIILESFAEGILNTSIHMFFVFYPINVIWLNSKFEVVDIKRAKPFISLLSPKKPAKYIIELTKDIKDIKIGDKLIFKQKDI